MDKVDPVISVEWLAEVLASSEKNVRVLDGSYHLPDANRDPRAEYDSEHIPGALFFDIDQCADLTTKLPHMLPKPEDFEQYVGKLGINNDTHVVVYDTNNDFPLFSAERVWWTFRVFGHEKVSVLDGGLTKWRKHNKPLTSAVAQVAEDRFKARFNPRLVVNFEEVEANQYKEKKFDLFDTRPAEYYDGTAPSFFPGVKMGSIPGSVNFPFTELMDVEQQKFKSKEELLKTFEQFSIDLNTPVAATCGSGIWACHLALAAYLCGKEDVAVYDGSWVEWYLRTGPDRWLNVLQD
ncbi:3-mercaptopyruvate sulfurtransferase-like [Babylonia areolata]|uniref:3-mercaptopyruvate sulfurtransferase-like n=1 Tax=Babylonia areolata TaxID=304850 RepID=UPI003FD27877